VLEVLGAADRRGAGGLDDHGAVGTLLAKGLGDLVLRAAAVRHRDGPLADVVGDRAVDGGVDPSVLLDAPIGDELSDRFGEIGAVRAHDRRVLLAAGPVGVVGQVVGARVLLLIQRSWSRVTTASSAHRSSKS